jgi:protein TonB
MFANTLLDGPENSRRKWTTLLSFLVQSTAIALLLILPLFYTEGLPTLKFLSRIISLPVPAGPPVASQPHSPTPSTSNFVGTALQTPHWIPRGVPVVDDHGAAPIPNGLPTLEGATGPVGDPNRVLNSILGPTNRALIPIRPAVRPPQRVSVMMEGLLIHRVEPPYPPLAKAARIQGTVQLQAIIGKNGAIQNLQVLSGHPMLVTAAVEAVHQWRYRPYLLNGEPVEVETQITVNFVLSRN